MISRHWLTLVRAGTLLALLTSAALLLHYVDPAGATSFCGDGSGCEAVRKQAPRLFGLPHFVPLSGVVGFVLLLWASFLSNPRKALLLPALSGGVIGLGLLGYQAFAIGEFCSLCLLVDTLALGIAGAAVALWRTSTPQAEPLRGWAWGGLFALSLNTPAVWDKLRPEEGLPPALAELQQAGALTVIEFVDLQCPHCRRFTPVLESELELIEKPVHLVRLHVPLAFHPLAQPAARAALCGRSLGKPELEERLLTLPLSEDVWFEHAKALGLDATAFENCLSSDATTTTLAEHRALFDATDMHALPLTYVGNQRIEGAADGATVHRAVSKALHPSTSVPGWLFTLGVVAIVRVLVLVGRKRESRAS